MEPEKKNKNKNKKVKESKKIKIKEGKLLLFFNSCKSSNSEIINK